MPAPPPVHRRRLPGVTPGFAPARPTSGRTTTLGGLLFGVCGIAALLVAVAAFAGSRDAKPTTPPTVTRPGRPQPTEETGPTTPGYIVQVASETTSGEAQRIAQQLTSAGWQMVGVLRSDRYRELHPGHWLWGA